MVKNDRQKVVSWIITVNSPPRTEFLNCSHQTLHSVLHVRVSWYHCRVVVPSARGPSWCHLSAVLSQSKCCSTHCISKYTGGVGSIIFSFTHEGKCTITAFIFVFSDICFLKLYNSYILTVHFRYKFISF